MKAPVKGKISSPFGIRIHPFTGIRSFHNGVDISVPVGTPIIAPEYGIIMKIWDHERGGRCMAMMSVTGKRYGFAHLNKRLAKLDYPVAKGQVIAHSGNSGLSTGPHLHFTVQVNRQWVDPQKYFGFGSQGARTKTLSIVLIILGMLLLSSCFTQKSRTGNFTPGESDHTVESSREITHLRDTTVYVYIKGDTVFDTIKVKVGPTGLHSTKVSTLNTDLAISRAWVAEGRLSHTLEQRDTLAAQLIKDALRSTEIQSQKERVVTKVMYENRLTQWQLVQLWMGRAFMVLVLSILAIFLIRIF